MEKINGRKLSLIFIFILILLVIALLVGKFTYSYLGPTISDDLETQGEVTASGDTLIFTKGNNLSLSATTDNFTTGGTNLSTTTNPKVKLVASTKTNQASATYYVGVLIKNNTYVYTTSGKTPELILTIKDEKGNNVSSGVDGLTYVTSGGVSGFDVTGKNGLFNIKTDYPISTNSSTTGTTHTWTFTLTFVNLSTDQSVNENANLNVDVYLQKIPWSFHTSCNDNTLACHVAKLYTGTQGENSIYYHDNSLENGAKDFSYRYAGPSDEVNNFVCFGTNASPCPENNLYRIVGVFGENFHGVSGKQLVKLIKYDYMTTDELGTDGDYYGAYTSGSSTYKGNNYANIASYYWNNDTTTNTWSESLLNKTNLNTNFINYMGEEWANKIAMTTWKVGGNTMDNIVGSTPSVAYTNEITNPDATNSTDNATEYQAKIGLMYGSDYGFAASPSAWTLRMGSYNNITATNNNWMYMGLYEWTISRNADNSNRAFNVDSDGYVGDGDVNSNYVVRPSFNLESSVNYVSGSGSMSAPIVITD